ncbi:hypothetical protein Trydic_g7298 [Trypoxylus dichotomus]
MLGSMLRVYLPALISYDRKLMFYMDYVYVTSDTFGQHRRVLLYLAPQDQSEENTSDCVHSDASRATTSPLRERRSNGAARLSTLE